MYTIAAQATPYGIGAIACIRMSGDDAVEIADRVFKAKTKLVNAKTHTVHHGYIISHENGNVIDEVMVSVMLAPHTFTGENTVEISTHGGISAPRAVLNELIYAGARPAEPGEFSKRAFLNGKMDLSQAEAVIDIINSKTDIAQKNAVGQLEGRLSSSINDIRQLLVNLAAHMQVSIDYPDEDVEELTAKRLHDDINAALCKVNKLIKTADDGKIITEGITTAIVGTTNVGKSSVLNMLSGNERAIVTDIEGTTRDVISENISLNGIPLVLLDTAGIRNTQDKVESIGIEKSRQQADAAQLVIAVLDGSRNLNRDDLDVLEFTKTKQRIILINKTDIAGGVTLNEVKAIAPDTVVLEVSAKTGDGMDSLASAVRKMYDLEGIYDKDISVVTNLRHKTALINAQKALMRANESLNAGMPFDITSIDINEAISYLGEITGKTVTDDIVNSIFHRFCVGK